ncbi:glutamate receptor ionotropic, kainate glr-3-like [Liolophura sinensis]|uniref:glutamate receptor ionotropic, kainate glr-3-like n=1 Tax=Liolophura sinensis TaxID=3198878 RepID=UPI003158EE46
MTILVESGTSTWTLFEQSNLDLYRSINAKKKPVEKSEIGIDAVKKGGHCFIGGRVSLQFGVSESCGEIRIAEEQFFSSSYAFVLPKLSPYKKAINFRILKLVEYGIVKNLKDQWFNTITVCSQKTQNSDFIRLSMKTLGGVFLAYGIVAVLGVIILILEKIRVRLDLKLSAPPSCHG